MSFRDMYFTEEPYSRRCTRCGHTFRKEEAFNVHPACYPPHLMTGARIQCYSCDFSSTIVQTLRQHVRQKHLPRKFTCIVTQTSSGICGQKFSSKQSVLNHVEKHFRHMQAGKSRKERRKRIQKRTPGKKRTAVSPDTDSDSDSETESETEAKTEKNNCVDEYDEPVSQPERVTASPEKSEPVTTPPSVTRGAVDDVEQDNSLRLTLTQLLDQLSHCSGCNGYFVTDDDLNQHYNVHTQAPKREKADSADSDVPSHCENSGDGHIRLPKPDPVANEMKCDTITLD